MRLIDIDAFLAENCIERISANDGLDWGCDDCQKCNARYLEVSCDRLLKFPTVSQKQGRWISDRLVTTSGGTYGVRRCSLCEAYYQDVGYGWHYCPNCGASMKEVTE